MLDTEVTEEHQEGFVLRQVELNTIAAGLGGMASKIPYLHRYVCWEVPYIEGTIAAVNLGVQRLVWGKNMHCACREACPIFLSFSLSKLSTRLNSSQTLHHKHYSNFIHIKSPTNQQPHTE